MFLVSNIIVLSMIFLWVIGLSGFERFVSLEDSDGYYKLSLLSLFFHLSLLGFVYFIFKSVDFESLRLDDVLTRFAGADRSYYVVLSYILVIAIGLFAYNIKRKQPPFTTLWRFITLLSLAFVIPVNKPVIHHYDYVIKTSDIKTDNTLLIHKVTSDKFPGIEVTVTKEQTAIVPNYKQPKIVFQQQTNRTLVGDYHRIVNE